MVVNIVYETGEQVMKHVDGDTPIAEIQTLADQPEIDCIEIISARPVPIAGVLFA